MNKVKLSVLLILIIIGIIGLIISEEEMVVNGDEIEANNLETKIVLYFSNLKTGELVKEYRYVNIEKIKENLIETIINELLKGPKNDELNLAIPSGTKVNFIKQSGDKIEVDFSKEYLEESRRYAKRTS